jgi:extracellular factor (EF) 3-hydroxypalmitic acid methyl ester biosynthesis protein
VIDLSATGFAAASPSEAVPTPGSVLESFDLLLGDRMIWSGEAVVVHGAADRVGGRFTSGILELRHLRLQATLEERMAILQEQKERLPAEWRAAVAELRLLLESVRDELEEVEHGEARDPMRWAEEEEQLFSGLLDRWGRPYYGAVARLHAMSQHFDTRTAMLGRGYATAMIMPLLMACPLHRRSYEKPLGYAGDYRMMELFCADRLSGDGLVGRFLHLIMQNYTMSRSVRARQEVLRQAIERAIQLSGDGAIRVLAVAAGPAIELRRVFEKCGPLQRPVQIILLDQDPSAHESAHSHLTRILLERHHGTLPVSVRCLHFSVRQLLKPETPEDHRVLGEITDIDLIYSAGLYDYLPDLVARRLTRVLYARLRPGGRLLVGNMVETPDSTWMLEFVLGWQLLYRTDQAMLRLAQYVSPTPERIQITPDATGCCMFLDLIKPVEAVA